MARKTVRTKVDVSMERKLYKEHLVFYKHEVYDILQLIKNREWPDHHFSDIEVELWSMICHELDIHYNWKLNIVKAKSRQGKPLTKGNFDGSCVSTINKGNGKEGKSWTRQI